jgi:hypothetical protein
MRRRRSRATDELVDAVKALLAGDHALAIILFGGCSATTRMRSARIEDLIYARPPQAGRGDASPCPAAGRLNPQTKGPTWPKEMLPPTSSAC